MRLVAGAASDVGKVREGNEDSFLVDDHLELYAVADGMGGHRGGEVASATALEALRAAVASQRVIPDAIELANAAVFERASADEALRGMGTTLTAVVATGGSSLLVGHVGDSRAYLLRDGALTQRSEDHSLVEELVRQGRLTRDQADVHPQRNIVTRALGIEPQVEVDLYTVTVRPGDRVVLCSDGLTTMLRDREIERILRNEPDPRLAADRLVDAANDAGGEDNITVLVLDVLEVDDDGPPDPEALALDVAGTDAADDATEVPATDDDPGASAAAAPRDVFVARPSTGRRIVGVLVILVPVLLVVGVAVGALGWYARRSFYVALDDTDHVALYRGIPGGVLGWDPTVERRTEITVDEIPAFEAVKLGDGAAKGSRAGAEAYIEQLRTMAAATATTTTTSAPTTTTSGADPPGASTTRPTVATGSP